MIDTRESLFIQKRLADPESQKFTVNQKFFNGERLDDWYFLQTFGVYFGAALHESSSLSKNVKTTQQGYVR